MRRLLILTVFLCLAVPSAAFALSRATGDGTLVVKNGVGVLRLDITGAVIGRLEGGQLELIAPAIDDCSDFDVWGADRTRPRRKDGLTSCLFTEFVTSGTPQPIRFRILLGDQESIVLRSGGAGFSLSAVGKGKGSINGVGGLDGVYSLNGERLRSLPDDGSTFTLGATLR